MPTETFSVIEMSEKLNKSKYVIYSYLKKGELKGTRKNRGSGAWEIEYDDSIDNEKRDLEETPITKITINENVYMGGLQKVLNRYDKAIEDIVGNLKSKFNILHSLKSIEGPTSFISSLPLKLQDLIDNDESYIYLNENKSILESKILNLAKNYKELDYIIKPITIKEIHYSKISESVYVINNLISFLNRLSEINKRFIIISESVMSKDLIKLRFSNHIPDYYKKGSMSIMEKERDIDIMIPYSELEQNIDCIPKKQTDEDVYIINQINKKIKVVKDYSDKPLKKLNKTQLKHFYDVSKELLNNEQACKDKFVSQLPDRLPGIINRLRINGISV